MQCCGLHSAEAEREQTLTKPFSTGPIDIQCDGCVGSSVAQADQRGLPGASQIVMSHCCLVAAACVLLPQLGTGIM